MKKSLLLILVVMAASLSMQAQIYSENFNGTSGTALPVDWTQKNGSGWVTGTKASMSSDYFTIDVAHDGRFVGVNDDRVQASPNSNALLVSTYFSLKDETSAALSFYGYYLDAVYEGKQEVLTVETSVDHGATWQVLKQIDGNTINTWEKRTVNMTSLAGTDSILLGFRYKDGGGWLYGVFIDDVEIFRPRSKDAVLSVAGPDYGSLSSYAKVGTSVEVTTTVYNNAAFELTDFTINYQDGNNPVQSYSPTASIAPFESAEFTHDIPLEITELRDYPLNIWVSQVGDEDYTNDTLTTAGFKTFTKDVTKKPLYEEATGTWCGWCPRGTVGMENLAEEHPGEAAQVAVHNNDPMAVPAYDALIGTYIEGYPQIVYDRRVIDDPGNILDAHAGQRSLFGFAEVTMGEVAIDELEATIPVTITPSVNIEGGKVAIIVTESNIRGVGTPWNQVNYYANNAAGPLQGWETQAAAVPNTFFHFVGRSIEPDVNGGELTLPATMVADETYTIDLVTTLDPTWKKHNLQYIVLLIGADNTVYNTASSALPELIPALEDVEGTLAVKPLEGVNKVTFYPNPVADNGTLDIDIKEGTSASVSITDVVGKVVYRKPVTMTQGSNKYSINTSALNSGIYFITVSTAKGQTTLMFSKTN